MNLFFLVMALTKVYRSKKSARRRSTLKKSFMKKKDPEAAQADTSTADKMNLVLFRYGICHSY